MPSIANLSIRNLYDHATEFLYPHSPSYGPPLPSAVQSSDTPGPNFPTSTSTKSIGPEAGPRECTLRERLNAACHSPSSSLAGHPPSSMRRELDLARNELAKSQSEVSRLDERCKMLEKTLKETREMLKARDVEIEKMRKEREKERLIAERRRSDVGPLYQPPQRPGDLHSRHSSLDMRTIGSRLANRYPNEPSDQERALALAGSEEERARIRANEIYMTRTDSWSGAQVLQAVRDINSEILQFAASATELCTFDRNSRPSSSKSVQAMHDTSSRLGPNLARILSNRDHSQDPILVQLALQGCVAMCIIRALAAFCIGFSAKTDQVLSHIYSKMAIAEPQPTSSKWRALTHRYIHMSYPHLVENSTDDLCDTILRWSSDIIIIAGCSSYETAAASSKDGLRVRFGDRVRQIAKAATRLARVTKEEMMSTCFDVIAVNQSDIFDSSRMSDAFGDYVASRGAIIATIEIGLKCTTRLRGEETHEEVVLEQRVLLQPKVVLESVLDVLGS